ncbi:hypothetical protein TGFOU_209120A, partial [Toxoplasma gondii FOU]
MATPTLSPN